MVSIADFEPNKLYKIEILPPTNSPKAFPFTSKDLEGIVYEITSPNNAFRKVSLTSSGAFGTVNGIMECKDATRSKFN